MAEFGSDEIRTTSCYQASWATQGKVYDPKKLELFLDISPTLVVDLNKAMPLGQGAIVGKNVYLLHPCLGSAAHNHIYKLYENQLEWLAQKWAEICGRVESSHSIRVDAMDRTPILVAGGEFGSYLITPKGKIVDLHNVGGYDS